MRPLTLPLIAFAILFVSADTPQIGALNPDVTQETIHDTICIPGWTRTIRPPEEYTRELKQRQMQQRHLPGRAQAYEEDHFYPLELGGHPSDPQNLNPQPWNGACSAHDKDLDENEYHAMVCRGELTLAEAQHMMYQKWAHCFR